MVGEAFVVSPRVGTPFTVIVPEGAQPGTFIQVTVPEASRIYSDGENDTDVDSNSRGCTKIKIQKETAGAALVGGVIGTICLGPIGGLVLAGGAAYCTTRKRGKIGSTSRMIGKQTYESAASAKNWVEKKLSFH